MTKKKSGGTRYFGKSLTDDPDDAPELRSAFFLDGELRHGDKLIRRGRPPLSGKPKTAITLRLDEDVVEAYRETGEGWQTRINADLRRARKLAVKAARAHHAAQSAPWPVFEARPFRRNPRPPASA
jgi:uncharacterized protein (DUF4415 family)